MKKFISSGLLVLSLTFGSALVSDFGFCNCANAAVNKTVKADIRSIRIPAGTTMKMEILEPVSSHAGSIGDEFSAMLKQDIAINGQIALPAGTIIRGTINKLTPSKRLSRSAVLYFSFDHVVTPTGKQIPVNAGLYNYKELTIDGGVYDGGNYGYAIQQNWQKTKDIFNKTIEWGKGTGDNMQYLCVPLGAAGGVIGGAAYYVGMAVADLFMKGNEVDWLQGKEFEIMLTQPLDIPMQ